MVQAIKEAGIGTQPEVALLREHGAYKQVTIGLFQVDTVLGTRRHGGIGIKVQSQRHVRRTADSAAGCLESQIIRFNDRATVVHGQNRALDLDTRIVASLHPGEVEVRLDIVFETQVKRLT